MVATACRGDELSWGDEGELPPGGAAIFDGATHSRNSWALPFNCAVRANVPRSYAMTNDAYPWEDSEKAQDREYCLGADANGDGRISFREASDFAASNDAYALKGKETPQFAESTPGLGAAFFSLKDVEPISLESPIVCDTAGEASNRMAKAAFTPSVTVETKLGRWSPTLATYRNMFTFKVVETEGGQWAVEAVLTPEAESNLVENASAATRQIPLADIAALPTEGKKDVTVTGCVPGFYYTLYGAATLPKRGGGGGFIETALPETATAYGPVLCEPDKPVTFEAVEKPSDAAGFFSIGARAVRE